MERDTIASTVKAQVRGCSARGLVLSNSKVGSWVGDSVGYPVHLKQGGGATWVNVAHMALAATTTPVSALPDQQGAWDSGCSLIRGSDVVGVEIESAGGSYAAPLSTCSPWHLGPSTEELVAAHHAVVTALAVAEEELAQAEAQGDPGAPRKARRVRDLVAKKAFLDWLLRHREHSVAMPSGTARSAPPPQSTVPLSGAASALAPPRCVTELFPVMLAA